MKKTFLFLLLVFLLVLTCCVSVCASGYTVICAPQYNMAEAFESTVTKVSKNSKWALADTTGTAITSYQWEAMGDIASTYTPAKKDGKWGYISPNGSVLISYQYAGAGMFIDGLAKVQEENGKSVYINTTGAVQFVSPFTVSFSPSGGAVCGAINDLYGYCDTQGTIIIPPRYEMAFDFHEGYAAVRTNGKWGYITSYGDYAVTPVYDYASDFKNGYAICRLGGKFGIIDTKGARVSSFTFDHIGAPDEKGRFPAKAGTTCGFIRADGSWVLKTSYDFCYTYTNGAARVYKDGKWGFIDETGAELVPPTFADCGEYHNGRAPYSEDGTLWGYLSLDFTKATTPVKTPAPAEKTAAPAQPTKTPVPVTTPTPVATSTPAPVATATPAAQNPAAENILPLAPNRAKCISMRIGSTVALDNDGSYTLATAPVLADGVSMVPVRDIVELLGGNIAWDAKRQQINISYKFRTINIYIGSAVGFINGVPSPMPHAPILSNDTTLVPLRSVAEGLGFEIQWMHNEQNIYIYY